MFSEFNMARKPNRDESKEPQNQRGGSQKLFLFCILGWACERIGYIETLKLSDLLLLLVLIFSNSEFLHEFLPVNAVFKVEPLKSWCFILLLILFLFMIYFLEILKIYSDATVVNWKFWNLNFILCWSSWLKPQCVYDSSVPHLLMFTD